MKVSLGARTIAFPLPVWVIGTYNEAGRPNAMTASWAGVCCSQPPCVYFSARASRYTYKNVQARKAFTVNIPELRHAAAADYLGLVSGQSVDKFAVARLTPVRAEHVDAPAVAEFPLTLECRLVQAIELGTHAMFIGEIADVKCAESVLGLEGKPDMRKLRPFIYSTADAAYYAVERSIGRAYELGLIIEPSAGPVR